MRIFLILVKMIVIYAIPIVSTNKLKMLLLLLLLHIVHPITTRVSVMSTIYLTCVPYCGHDQFHIHFGSLDWLIEFLVQLAITNKKRLSFQVSKSMLGRRRCKNPQ